MEIVVRGRNVEVPEHFRQHVEDKVGQLERFDAKIERFDVRRKDGSVATVAITVVGDADDEGVRPPLRLRDKALPA